MDCKEFKNIVADLFDKEVDPQLKAECEKHISQCAECKEYYENLLTTAEFLRPKHSPVSPVAYSNRASHRWMKVAAMFAGVVLLSGLAFAAIRLMSPRTTEGNVQVVESNSQRSMPTPQHSSPVHFDDVPLDSILTVVAAHYGKAVSFRSEETKGMKFIMTWRPDAPLADFIDGLNMFDGLQLTLLQDTIFVDAQDRKENVQ
ncbi:MAG: hypothetical protein IJP82_10920 [Bacteroidaceae bacterium]|nr:hypothetical protein [Bacteroidaceae bacterium]